MKETMRKLFSITSTTLVLPGGLHAEALELPAFENLHGPNACNGRAFRRQREVGEPLSRSARRCSHRQTVGLSLLHPREDAQFSYRHASYQQLPRIPRKATEEIDRFGHLTGLTRLRALVECA